ncbi:MAG: amino acid adenylation domain-containing protein [Peptococcaceae bacterium]|nr:amino acid adenylation domain-containing protein [Peptococcaceae bacterium]
MDAYLQSLSIQKAISTLDQLIDKCAKSGGGKPKGIIFVQDDGTETFESYPELYGHAKQILGALQNRGIQQGSYVIFQMANNQSFIRVFWACILGGIIPVPLSVPVTASPDTEAFRKLIKVAEHVQDAHIVAEGVILDNFQSIYKEHTFNYFSYEELAEEPADILQPSYQGQCAVLDSRDTAYIQYSSGSTGDPKGIVLTHENLAFNVSQANDRLNLQKNDVAGSWMPLTHDMGLIVFHLVPMLAGMTHFLLSPNVFIKKPWLYLQKSSQLKATITASPNFGLEWMIDKTQASHLTNMDLSKIRVLLCGAEPISMDTIRKFYAKFSDCGLRDKTIYQSYGMAEACVAVTCPVEGHNESVHINRHKNHTGQHVEYVSAEDPNAAEFAVLGCPIKGMEIAVVDDNDTLLQENQIGNIVIKGPNVFGGYLHQTNTPFTKQGFFHTGDSGFIRQGQLIIAGRKKDILFVNGQNYYASDIEKMLSSALPQHSQTVVCAFRGKAAVRDEIIIFVRYRSKVESFLPVIRQIQDTVFERIGIAVDYVIPIKGIPKTTSGKVQRYRLTEQFGNHEFDTVLEEISHHDTGEYAAPRTPEEKRVVETFEKILSPTADGSQRQISVTDRIIDLGGNSLKTTWLCNEIEKNTGVRLPLKDIFSLTPRQIAEKITHSKTNESPKPSAFTEIPRIPEAESHPMSPIQKQLYIVDELRGPNITYNIPGVIHIKRSQLKKKIKTKRLQKALNKLLEQEEILRTSFHQESGKLVQKIDPSARVLIETTKCKKTSAIDIQIECQRFVQPFDLSKAPLLRVKLMCTPQDIYLFIDIHHIISDGISQPILMYQIKELYEGRDLPTPRVQYKDYSAWQNARDISDQAAYWQNEFSGEIPILDLRTDSPRSQEQSHRGSSIQAAIAGAARTRIQEIAQEHGATEFMVMLTAFMILLGKYSRQEEIIVGTPISGRTHADTETMLGMFVNTLAIKGNIRPDESFEILLSNIKEKCLQAYDNQEYPFEDLVESVEIRRDFSRNPIFDIMFVLQETEGTEDILGGTWTPVEAGAAKFDLTLTVIPTPGEYAINFEYCTELFKAETIEQMARHYTNLIITITENPKQKIKEIRMTDVAEEEKVLVEFNTTDTDYPRDKTVVQLFEEQVIKTPNNTAVVFEDQALTYKELNTQANRLAWKLRREYTIRPGDFVALLTERSLEMIVGIYAILKSGAAYVPIDPTYPRDRIEYILRDSKPKATLCNTKVPEIDVPILYLEPDDILRRKDKSNDAKADNNPPQVNQPHDLMYVIYTSGTTGRPKGVMIEHVNVVRLLKNDSFQYEFTENDIWTMFHSHCFDVSVWEIFGSAFNGAKLIVPSRDILKDAYAFSELLRREAVTILCQVPSPFYALMDAIAGRTLESLRYVIFAGEALHPTRLKEWYENNRHCRLVNMYGTTETTVHATYREIGDIEIQKGISDAGTALPTLKIYILTGNEVCGIGVPGELCIAGDGVARGYLNRPELTAEKFVDNPFGEGRMYRTGDLARWLPDGNIEYLGRIDDQIKIRGFRVEPGEIESRLLKQPGISAAAVITREDKTGDKTLCGYIVTDATANPATLKSELRKTLPEYMIPAYIIEIDSIPLTRNGKLDRSALPEPECKTKDYTAPRNRREKQITEAFEKVLGLATGRLDTKVSITDSFFNLGGHSLKATKLCNEIEKVTGVRLPLKDIFTLATPENIAAKTKSTKAGAYTEIPRIAEAASYPMSSAQKRLYLLDQLIGPNITYNIPSVMQLKDTTPTQLQVALDTLLEQEEILRTSFHMPDGEPIQKITPKAKILLESIETDTLDLQAEYNNFVRPFTLSQAPLLRAKLVRTPQETHLFIDTHHIISDGISQTLMQNRIQTLCESQNHQADPHITLAQVNLALPPQRIHYKDYSAWQSARDISDQAAYWQTEFSGEIPILNLRTDFPRPQEQSHKGSNIQATIADTARTRIQEIAQKHGATEFMVMLTAFMILLGRYSRQEEIIVGTPISGRTRADTETMLGMFVNTLAIKGEIRSDESFETLLHCIKEKCLQAYDNQEYPFEDLVEAVEVTRDLSRNPIFDIMFVLQETPSGTENILNGIKRSVETGIAKFDLTLTIVPTSEGYAVTLEYNTDLFKSETIKQMAAHYTNLIKTIIENPKQKVKEIRMTDAAEEEKILVEFNATDTDYPHNKTIVQLFEEQVIKTPNNTAVVFGSQTLSYKGLNTQANRLASQLRQEYKIQPNDFVAILTERSLEMIIGIYAILKSGAAYVPIDPTYPQERIEYILNDSKPKVTLCSARVPEIDIPILYLPDILQPNDNEMEDSNLAQVNQPHDLMYIIYTSGTTGKPKGVMVEHVNVVRLLKNDSFQFEFNEKDVWTLFHSYCFDFSVWEIFGSTLNGAKLIVLSEDTTKDAFALGKLLNRENVTILSQVPSSFNTLMAVAGGSAIKSLRYVIFGGEALNPSRLKEWHERNRHCRLVNMYGITETTVHVTYKEIGDREIQRGISNVGTGIPTLRVHILNGSEVCGIGVPGELCVAGDGVARGYLNHPELTAEKFIKNPFGKGRMYRTGDLARWLPDGNIEYLGRIDEQVKIRGYRIEPGEIESRLLEQPGISGAVVITQEDKTGEKYLCAYITVEGYNQQVGGYQLCLEDTDRMEGLHPPKRPAEIKEENIKISLRKSLPEYMVPAYIVQLGTIPLTRSGKLDRAVLPTPEYKTKEYTAPRTTAEKQVTEAFEAILGIEQVSVTDNFFDLGGHSLKATILLNELEKITGVRLSLKEIFSLAIPQQIAEKIVCSKADDPSNPSAFTEIPRTAEAEIYPMSSAQKRLYILDELIGPNITYNIPGVIRIKGSQPKIKKNEKQLQKVLDILLEQEEILRTSFHHKNGELIQRISPDVRILLETTKYKKAGMIDIQTECKKFVQPFNLSQAPLMRVKLLRTPKDTYLFIDIHHIISDGISLPILLRQIRELYNNKTQPPRSQVHYKDYSAWQSARDISDQAAYWQNEFSGDIPILDLRTDFPRPQEQTFKGSSIRAKIEAETRAKVRELANKHGATEFMVMLSAFMILLGKYSLQKEIIVGTPISGRTHIDTENMLGMFVNTLAIKGNICPDESFATLLNSIKEKCLQAYSSQEYPFEDLVEAVKVRRDFSRNPIFDVMFSLQDGENFTESLFDGTWEPIETGAAKFDLTLTAVPTPEGYIINLEYSTDLFKPETITQMAEHYSNLIKTITENPEQKIKGIRMTNAAEEEKILIDFNATNTEYPRHKTVVQLFEEQVARTPNNTAIIFEDQKLSYKELNVHANHLARKLRQEYKIQPDDFVAILTERSLEMIVGIFAILKSGAAYVPIDPTYPEERIRFVLEDCQPKAILVGPGGFEVSAGMPVNEMTINLCSMDNYANNDKNPEHINGPENLAYLIYTSGTTGNPKGVMVEHRGVNNHLNVYAKNLDIDSDNTIGMFHNYIFDATVSEIMTALLTGARLVVLNQNQVHNTDELNAVIQGQKIDIITLPPQYAVRVQLNTIKTLITAGSEAQPEILNNVSGRYINAYGPTEDTICTTYWELQKGDVHLGKIPIGRPTGNTKVYILNGEELCGIGVPGELRTTGDGVARGYLNRPGLTAEKFVNNPFGEGKMYRTGDLARWLPDGNIEYLGRIDEQVKIRGFRIEPGEIESRLLELPGISAAAVIAREDKAGEKYLCAYVTAEGPTEDTLKANLRKVLPEYMIPAFMIQLDTIPLTRNGKLDKAALPIPKHTTKDYTAPRTTKEKHITKAFETILGLERVSVTDSFFDLGGDSIKALRILSKIRETGYNSTMGHIMKDKTPEQIAKNLTLKQETIAPDQGEISGEVPLTPIQRRFFAQNLRNPEHFNQSQLYEINVRPDKIHLRQNKDHNKTDTAALRKALSALTEHHDMLRATLNTTQKASAHSDICAQYMIIGKPEDQDGYGFTEIECRVEDINKKAKAIQASMKLNSGPLMQAALFHTTLPIDTPQKDYLLLVIHHLVIDGVSWRILSEDLETAYSQALRGQTITLPAKTTSFKAWSEGLIRYQTSPTLRRETPYWSTITEKAAKGRLTEGYRLKEAKPPEGYDYWTTLTNLDTSTTETLLKKSSHAYNTEINDLLLAALGRAVNKVTGQKTLTIQMEGHGREDIPGSYDLGRTVGWFTSIYPVVLEELGSSLSQDIRNTKETLRRIPQHGIGYGILMQESQADLETTPDITFNYLGEFGAERRHHPPHFTLSELPHGHDVDPRNQIGTPVVLNSHVHNGKLTMTATYNSRQYQPEIIEQLCREYKNQLQAVAEHCHKATPTEPTASDFGETSWTDSEFRHVKETLAGQGKEIERIYALTPMQEGMLFEKLAHEESAQYVVQQTLQIAPKGVPAPIKEGQMKKAFESLVKRHEVLRTTIKYQEVSVPRQIVLKERPPEYRYAEVDTEQDYQDLKIMDVKRGFNLEQDTLIRMILVKVRNNGYKLIITNHHIIMDGWCQSILYRDLFHAYLENKDNKGSAKEALPVERNRFETYVKHLEHKDKEASLKYWEDLLAGYETCADIRPMDSVWPMEQPDAAAASQPGVTGQPDVTGLTEEREEESRSKAFTLRPELAQQIESTCAKYSVTVNTLVEAAWGLLLQKYNATNDVIFGKVVSGRNAEIEGIEDMVGLFINTVPVRVAAGKEETLITLLGNLQKQALDGNEHDYCPLAEIQNRSALGSGLIGTLVVFENYYVGDIGNHNELDVKFESAREQISYPLGLIAYKGDTLHFKIMYNTREYGEQEIEILGSRLLRIIEQSAAHPEQKVKEIRMTDTAEEAKVLVEFNAADTEYPQDKTIIQLFEEQVAKTPNNIAVVFEEQKHAGILQRADIFQLTYKELNAQANRLARKLRQEYNIQPNNFVAILTKRSLEMIIGIYAILKSGAAYVPIDPEYPQKRIQHILEDCGAKVLLKTTEQIKSISDIPQLDLTLAEIYAGSANNITSIKKPTDIAYMIHTSGSAGKPKGTMIEERSAVNFLTHIIREENLNKGSVVLQKTSCVFDVSIWELFAPLLSGGRIVLLAPGQEKDPNRIADAIEKHKVTDLSFVPSALKAFLPHLEDTDPRLNSVKVIQVAGEALSAELVKSYTGPGKMVNYYGPTEGTVYTTKYTCTGKESKIPIGKPIANTKIYILNEAEFCGIGVPGELCVAGDGVARGYLNRPKLTAEKFVDNPFGEGKMYRSGDLARWLPDGNIEYLGRIDDQVKIRGYRIELGEIESRLLEQPGISGAAVIAREDKAGERYLCAYITGERYIIRQLEDNNCVEFSEGNQQTEVYQLAEVQCLAETLKTELRKTLPEYMVPAHIVQLDSIPLTRNGKLDRTALPIPEYKAKKYTAPTNHNEELVVMAFTEVLGIDGIGIEDGFFDIGGDSIKALRVVSKIKHDHVNVRLVLEKQTPKKIAMVMAPFELSWPKDPQMALTDFYTVDNMIYVMNDDKYSDNRQAQLFMIPSAAGYAAEFKHLVGAMNYDGRIFGMNDPKYYEQNSDEIENAIEFTVEKILEFIEPKFKDGDILIGYSYGGKILPLLAKRIEDSGKYVSRIIVLDAIINESHIGMTDEKEADKIALVVAKEYVFRFFGRKYTNMDDAEKFGVTPESIIAELAHRLVESPSDYQRIHRELQHSFTVNMLNHSNPVKFSSKIRADVSVIFTKDTLIHETSQCMAWETYTTGNFVYHVIDCDHNQMVTHHYTQVAKIIADWIRPCQALHKNDRFIS